MLSRNQAVLSRKPRANGLRLRSDTPCKFRLFFRLTKIKTEDIAIRGLSGNIYLFQGVW